MRHAHPCRCYRRSNTMLRRPQLPAYFTLAEFCWQNRIFLHTHIYKCIHTYILVLYMYQYILACKHFCYTFFQLLVFVLVIHFLTCLLKHFRSLSFNLWPSYISFGLFAYAVSKWSDKCGIWKIWNKSKKCNLKIKKNILVYILY